MSQQIVELCSRGAELNRSSKFRRGNVVYLSGEGKVIISGDIHGHRRNFEKIALQADLGNNPRTHVVLQEILHGGPEDDLGGCLSFQLFFDILEYQQQYPEQVHLIIGNHDTAIINDKDVLKGGKEMNKSLRDAMKRFFGDGYWELETALCDYLFSQPLAVKCGNGIWMSHSLPADRYVDDFDVTVFDRELEAEDFVRPSPVYLLTWGRRHSDQALEKLAELFETDMFVLGHQSQESGWSKAGKNLIILASEHNHGCVLEFDIDRHYTIDELAENVVSLASIS